MDNTSRLRSKKAVAVLAAGAVLVVAGLVLNLRFFAVAETGEQSVSFIDSYLKEKNQSVFVNSSAEAPFHTIQKEDHEALSFYKTPGGIVIKSHSESWNEDSLVLLNEELLKNKHGPEIETLHEIILYGGDSGDVLGQHTPVETFSNLEFYYGALPDDFSFKLPRDVSVIEIYDADNFTTIESIAWTLSHEYGHLYTFYYFFEESEGNLWMDANNNTLANSRYAELRDSDKYNLLTLWDMSDETYMREYERVLFEVAAEDYVQLMGSPTTRQTTDFYDVREQLKSGVYDCSLTKNTAVNAWPQFNMAIPFASEVPGLAEYFYSFIDEEPPIPEQLKQEININIERRSTGYDLVNGYQTFVYYVLSWNTPYQDTLYTLMCSDPDDINMALPIKTVYSGGTASATIGTVTTDMGDYINILSDGLNSGTKEFFVIAMLPDGSFYRSELLQYDF